MQKQFEVIAKRCKFKKTKLGWIDSQGHMCSESEIMSFINEIFKISKGENEHVVKS